MTTVPLNNFTKPATPATAPAYGSPAQQAIHSMIDTLTRDQTSRIDTLRTELDGLERALLDSAAKLKEGLAGHIDAARAVHDATKRVADTIDTIRSEQGFLSKPT